jgi:6-phosphogluconolactonase (cycloisomerase 2 family)
VTTYQWEAERGHLRPVQVLPSLPADYTGENTASEIVVPRDGSFVYCSNRGHDSIGVFTVDPSSGLLAPTGWFPSGGRTPRFISLDATERFLYAANEQSDTIGRFRRDGGRLVREGEMVKNASPVTIAFASLRN